MMIQVVQNDDRDYLIWEGGQMVTVSISQRVQGQRWLGCETRRNVQELQNVRKFWGNMELQLCRTDRFGHSLKSLVIQSSREAFNLSLCQVWSGLTRAFSGEEGAEKVGLWTALCKLWIFEEEILGNQFSTPVASTFDRRSCHSEQIYYENERKKLE
jgi:hypothetical protein